MHEELARGKGAQILGATDPCMNRIVSDVATCHLLTEVREAT